MARVLKTAFADPSIGGVAFLEGVLFLAILALGLAYVWRKGDLDWVKELSKNRPDGSPDLTETTEDQD